MINIQWYDNTSVTILDYEDGKFNIVLEGDTSHWKGALHRAKSGMVAGIQ